jgi:hypothetical protein
VLEDCHKRSCWKKAIGVGVPRPYRSDACVFQELPTVFNCSVLTFGVQ